MPSTSKQTLAHLVQSTHNQQHYAFSNSTMALKFVVVALTCTPTWAFCPSVQLRPVSNRGSNAALSMGYIPDGLSAEEWKKIQEKEKQKNTVNLGRVGPKGFKSRSFKAWQESGAGHLFPVDPKKASNLQMLVLEHEKTFDKLHNFDRKSVSHISSTAACGA